jgi:hypothetical protein
MILWWRNWHLCQEHSWTGKPLKGILVNLCLLVKSDAEPNWYHRHASVRILVAAAYRGLPQSYQQNSVIISSKQTRFGPFKMLTHEQNRAWPTKMPQTQIHLLCTELLYTSVILHESGRVKLRVCLCSFFLSPSQLNSTGIDSASVPADLRFTRSLNISN